MATWMLSTVNDGMSTEFVHWSKDGNTIFYKTTYRRVSFLTNSDTVPDIDYDNTNGYEVLADPDYDWHDDELDDELDDVVSTEWDWNDLSDPTAQAAVLKLWSDAAAAGTHDPSENDNEWDAMEAAGWENDETSVWLYGPLKIEQITPEVVFPDEDDNSDLDMTDPDDILEAQRRAEEDAAIAAEEAAYAAEYAGSIEDV
jgi:hypothetical protein